ARSLGCGVAHFAAAAALAGSPLLFRLQHGGPAGLWSGGLASIGGLGAIALVLVIAASGSPRSLADLADAFAPAAILALGIGRLGRFLGGCRYGPPTDPPRGVVLPQGGPPAPP